MRRYGVTKLQNIIQKVLASHVQKVKEKQALNPTELKPIVIKEDEPPAPVVSSEPPVKVENAKEELEEPAVVPENKEDNKFFKLMNKLMQNGTIPKKMKSMKKGSTVKVEQNEQSEATKLKPIIPLAFKITFKGILDKVLEHQRK